MRNTKNSPWIQRMTEIEIVTVPVSRWLSPLLRFFFGSFFFLSHCTYFHVYTHISRQTHTHTHTCLCSFTRHPFSPSSPSALGVLVYSHLISRVVVCCCLQTRRRGVLTKRERERGKGKRERERERREEEHNGWNLHRIYCCNRPASSPECARPALESASKDDDDDNTGNGCEPTSSSRPWRR